MKIKRKNKIESTVNDLDTLYMCIPCVHHEEPMSLDIIPNPNPNSLSRLFPILLDPKSFQTALDSVI